MQAKLEPQLGGLSVPKPADVPALADAFQRWPAAAQFLEAAAADDAGLAYFSERMACIRDKPSDFEYLFDIIPDEVRQLFCIAMHLDMPQVGSSIFLLAAILELDQR